jgi:hypothetical protein
VSDSTTHTQATVHETVGPNEHKTTLGPENVGEQAIVPGGLPILPRWLLKRLHLA